MYVKGLGIWLGLWILAFAVNAVLLHLGVSLHASYGSSFILASRDLLMLAIGVRLWKRWFPARYAAQSWRFSRLDQMSLGLVLLATAVYYQHLYANGEQGTTGPMITEQLYYRTPPRILTLVAFQQILCTEFLLDLNREHWGERRGLWISAAVFALPHLLAVLIDNPPLYALLITPACFVGFWFWGTARVRWASPWTPFFAHYLFYLGALLGKAWHWF